MRGAKHIRSKETSPYATHGDFCRIFEEDMNRLYLLAFLLTGDHSAAEKCFVRGIEDSAKGNPVFKEWAHSWARRTIIQKAIQMIGPRLGANGAPISMPGDSETEPAEIASVIALPAFERFVFVMTVLERYSDKECSLLLGCMRSDVVAARIRALQQIGNSFVLRNKLVSITSAEQTQAEDPRSAVQMEPSSPLSASA